MTAAAAQSYRVIDPGVAVVDLVRREVDALRRSAAGLVAAAPNAADKVRVVSAARVLHTIERAYRAPAAAAVSPVPNALAVLRSSVALTAPVMRRVLETLGADDPGTPTNGPGTDTPGGTGTDTPADTGATVPGTFAEHDIPTQREASDYYGQNAADTVDGIFPGILGDLRGTLSDIANGGGDDARDAAAAAANGAGSDLGTAVGIAVGALVGGPIGAAIGAFVGSAVFAFARNTVLRMLDAFEGLYNEIFG